MSRKKSKDNRYKALIEKIFFDRYTRQSAEIEFERADLQRAAKSLRVELPKNLGDVVYSLRYRTPMPEKILQTQSRGKEWIIEGKGRAKYVFRLVGVNRINPNANLASIKIPNATPEIVSHHALTDEQALLAVVRYNRLLDLFLGIVTFSLQSHLRTSVKSIGQIEIDEICVGVDRKGRQYVLPVQAKGGSDQLSVVQTNQDIACCAEKFPHLICRPISAQFVTEDRVALFELDLQDDEIKIVDEKHYRLVPASEIEDDDLAAYRRSG